MSLTLGKDCTLTVGGAISSVRNVTFTGSSRTIDVEEFGVRQSAVYSTGWSASVSFEALDSSDIDITKLTQGTLISVSGGVAGWSFDAIVTDITETEPLDGVVVYQVECRLTRSGLRA